jgi:GTPase
MFVSSFVSLAHQQQGVGTVVSGTLLQGSVKTNDTLLLGPDSFGQFIPTVIKSIQRRRMPARVSQR